MLPDDLTAAYLYGCFSDGKSFLLIDELETNFLAFQTTFLTDSGNAVFMNSNPFLILVFLLIHAASLILFCFLISVVFKKCKLHGQGPYIGPYIQGSYISLNFTRNSYFLKFNFELFKEYRKRYYDTIEDFDRLPTIEKMKNILKSID